jgi:hypothetical protein
MNDDSRAAPPSTSPAAAATSDLPSIERRRLLQRTAGLAAWVALPAGLSACGGGSDGSSGHNAGAADAAARQATLEQARAEFDRLRGGGTRADPEALAAALRTTGAYTRVDVMADGCVSASLPDGHHLVVGNNMPALPVGGSVGAPAANPAPATATARNPMQAIRAKSFAAAASGPPTGVPASRRARSYCCFSNYVRADGEVGDFQAFDGELREAGWDMPAYERPTIDVLKTLPELGFLNWSTHGGTLNVDGTILHALLTREDVNIENLIAYLPDLNAGNLVYYVAADGYNPYRGGWTSGTYYAITPAFIANYGWRFSADSVVLIHACASDNPALRAAFAAAGASLYGGWDKPVWVHRAAAANDAMVDFLLASNLDTPDEEPLNRAHDHVAVKMRCDADGLTRYDDPSEGGVANFNFTVLRGEPAGLMPSMGRLTVLEGEDRLVLKGSFGSVPGKVCVGTDLADHPQQLLPAMPAGTVTELSVERWSPGEIVATLPRSGPGSAGYVAVQVGQRWGNARALTRWSGTITVPQRGPGSLALDHTLAFSLRADVLGWRNSPHGDMLAELAAVIGTPEGAPSHWGWRASGANARANTSGGSLTVTWSGSGSVGLDPVPHTGDTEVYTIFGLWVPNARRFEVSIAGGRQRAVTVTQVLVSSTGTTKTVDEYTIELPSRLAADQGQPGMLWALGSEHDIPAGNWTGNEYVNLPTADPTSPAFATTIRWDRAAAEFPPDARGRGGV